nr:reverse transcriptase domain-containing protein [Tanacetum cinerariifolium]
VPVGEFTFPADLVVVDYKRDPRVPLILGRSFLRTARALIDVHGEEMILRDGDESTTFSANSLLEEFADELALISYPLDYDDNHAYDIESNIREIEFLFYQEKKLAVSYDSWLFEDFDPPFYELLVFKEVSNSMRLLPFS